ncbi:unnamed protein product [Toxocara canis]|uniref:Uncharacterized protein n=1 Tax=Toxocara canis TaxID=6265 RepID=A0A3P7FZU3_TOXCA|nr:unnamed protein product [Toxocara canis]
MLSSSVVNGSRATVWFAARISRSSTTFKCLNKAL